MEYILILSLAIIFAFFLKFAKKISSFSKTTGKKTFRKSIIFVGFVIIAGLFATVKIPPDFLEEQQLNRTNDTTLVNEGFFPGYDNENVSSAKVLRIVDGDTVEVLIDSEAIKVRVIGIDTPETVDPRKTVECFGMEASNKAEELLKVGNEIFLEADSSQGDKDRYSRLLRYIWINEDLDFGRTMIEEGYAYEYTYKLPYKYQTIYKNAQNKAEEEKKGLWAEDACLLNIKPTVKPTSFHNAYITQSVN